MRAIICWITFAVISDCLSATLLLRLRQGSVIRSGTGSHANDSFGFRQLAPVSAASHKVSSAFFRKLRGWDRQKSHHVGQGTGRGHTETKE